MVRYLGNRIVLSDGKQLEEKLDFQTVRAYCLEIAGEGSQLSIAKIILQAIQRDCNEAISISRLRECFMWFEALEGAINESKEYQSKKTKTIARREESIQRRKMEKEEEDTIEDYWRDYHYKLTKRNKKIAFQGKKTLTKKL